MRIWAESGARLGAALARPMAPRDPQKFDPADAHLLDTPKREDYIGTTAQLGLTSAHGKPPVGAGAL